MKKFLKTIKEERKTAVMYDFYAFTEKGLKHQKNSDYFFINDYISQDNSYKTTSTKNKFIFGIKMPFTMKTLISIKDPERGDIVVFKFPEDPDKDFIKRVIGIAGDIIKIKDKQVYVNNKPANYKQAVHKDSRIIPGELQPRDNFGPRTVPPNCLFVMGDNRDQSYDSRFWGFVNLRAVKGKAFMIYWSWDQENLGVRWGRIGNFLE